MRRLTIGLRPAVITVVCLLALPILIGLGAKWSARTQIRQLQDTASLLEVENGSYRTMTGALTGQIQSLETVIDDLARRSVFSAATAKAMRNLPAVVRARAVGGADPVPTMPLPTQAALTSPGDTFGVLQDLLEGLQSRLSTVQQNLQQREALAAATPSIWPTRGWLTAGFGERADPFTGLPEFHQGIDIGADKGTPVYATANGVVIQAAYTHDGYGRDILLKHGFGLETRYAHLSGFAVKVGEKVHRGQVIGYVGDTGRATGYHLHYEVIANGQHLNPLRLLLESSLRP